ncbi:MAG: hypothetical protein Q8P18_05840 [Pseudomonadota bacterium]|nr:hypothetical protein [Pseudomonadota bacterium]
MSPHPLHRLVAHARLDFTTFEGETDTRPGPNHGTLLEAFPRHVARDEKRGAEAVSLARYRPGARRGSKGIEVATGIGLDFDHLPTERASAVVSRLDELGLASLVVSTFSHQAGGDDDNCFRVLLHVSRPVRVAEYARVHGAVNVDLGGLADPKAKDAARLWYRPTCPAAREASAIYRWKDGAALDVDGLLERRLVPEDGPATPTIRRPLRNVNAPYDAARQLAMHRLNTEPSVRRNAAEALHAKVRDNRADGIPCPRCARRSVWFWLNPGEMKTARCDHLNSCGWWGRLDELLDAAGALGA